MKSPTEKGQPVIHEWFAVRFDGQQQTAVLSLASFLERTRFADQGHPNPGEFDVPLNVSSLLPDAVTEARAYISERRREFQSSVEPKLEKQRQSLGALQERQLSFLESEYPDDARLNTVQRNKKQERQRRIDQAFADYRRWVEETLTTEDSPFLRVAAVFIG